MISPRDVANMQKAANIFPHICLDSSFGSNFDSLGCPSIFSKMSNPLLIGFLETFANLLTDNVEKKRDQK